jgi:hypothetical protein
LAALGLHARAKSVLLRSLAPVRLECSLGHKEWLLLTGSIFSNQIISINHAQRHHQAPGVRAVPQFGLLAQTPRRHSEASAFQWGARACPQRAQETRGSRMAISREAHWQQCTRAAIEPDRPKRFRPNCGDFACPSLAIVVCFVHMLAL